MDATAGDTPLDPAVLAAAQGGDAYAWSQVLSRYAPRVFAMAQSRLRNPEEAEELTQAVFATIAATFARGDYAEVGRFESWLFRITMNRVRDLARSRERARRLVPSAPAGEPRDVADRRADNPADVLERQADQRSTLTALRAALEQLPDADREVLELRHHAGLSFQQIADLVQEPLGTLLARHHRALKKLRTFLETQQTTPPGRSALRTGP